MSSSLKDLLEIGKQVVEAEVEVAGNKAPGYFRRLTAGERYELLKGQKIARSGGQTSMELDLGLNEESKFKFVMFSVCNKDGSSFFKSLEEVKKADSNTVNALYKIASKVNGDKEDDDAAKKD